MSIKYTRGQWDRFWVKPQVWSHNFMDNCFKFCSSSNNTTVMIERMYIHLSFYSMFHKIHIICWALLLVALIWVQFLVGSVWYIFLYSSGLMNWRWGNHMIAPVPVNQFWRISVTLAITKPHTRTQPHAYFTGYTLCYDRIIVGGIITTSDHRLVVYGVNTCMSSHFIAGDSHGLWM